MCEKYPSILFWSFRIMLWNAFIFSFRLSKCLSLQIKNKNENPLAVWFLKIVSRIRSRAPGLERLFTRPPLISHSMHLSPKYNCSMDKIIFYKKTDGKNPLMFVSEINVTFKMSCLLRVRGCWPHRWALLGTALCTPHLPQSRARGGPAWLPHLWVRDVLPQAAKGTVVSMLSCEWISDVLLWISFPHGPYYLLGGLDKV